MKLARHEGELCRAKRGIQRREFVKASGWIWQGDDANSMRKGMTVWVRIGVVVSLGRTRHRGGVGVSGRWKVSAGSWWTGSFDEFRATVVGILLREIPCGMGASKVFFFSNGICRPEEKWRRIHGMRRGR